MSKTGLLVELSVQVPAENASMALLSPLGILLTLCLALGLLRRRRMVLALVFLLIGILPACSRYGYYQTTIQTRATLIDQNALEVRVHPGDQLESEDVFPIEGDVFTLDISR
jgi:hypothetical protein